MSEKKIVQREIFPLLLTVDNRMEILAMSVLLSNLVTRIPTIEDFYSIAELVAAYDIAEHGIADSSTRDLASRWRNYSFHLESSEIDTVTRGNTREGGYHDTIQTAYTNDTSGAPRRSRGPLAAL